jgi:glycosyltransferase involved in cell wall biosynthesis
MASSDVATASDHQIYEKTKNDDISNAKVKTGFSKSIESSHYNILSRANFIVAIPAYNEEIAIGSIVARCKKYADKVIVVDDGSKDHTAEIARLVGADVITHEKNGGYGAAIKTCFEVARKRDAEAMVILDADGQHNPDDIPALLDKMVTGNFDIVIGSRFVNGNGKTQKIPAYRKVGMRVLDTATEVGSGCHISDSQSGYRLYSRNAIREIDLGSNGMAAGSEILIQAADKKLKIAEVPINVRYDIEKTSSENPITHGYNVLVNIIGLISEQRPLLFFCVPGAMLLFIGVVSGIYAEKLFYTTGFVSVFYTAICAICILLATFSMFTGLILQSIQSIVKKIKT